MQCKKRKGGFRSWLWKVTRNKVIDRYRSEKREARGGGGSSAMLRMKQVPDPGPCIPEEEPTDELAMSELMRRAIARVQVEFEPRSGESSWRTAVDGSPTDLVAKELEVSAASVRQSRSRILRRLRLQLGDIE